MTPPCNRESSLGACRTGNWNHPESPPGFFPKPAPLAPFVSVERRAGRNSCRQGCTKSAYLPFRLVLLSFNLLGQGIEPFEVECNAHEIPFAFDCVQSAEEEAAKAHDRLDDSKDRLDSALTHCILGFP